MHELTLQTISVELRKMEAEQLGSVSGTNLVPNVANNILAVQHDVKKKIFAVIVENTTQIMVDDKSIFSIKMACLGIFSYQEKASSKQLLELVCRAGETIYNTMIFQKILAVTTSFGLAPLRAYITSITPEQIEGVRIEETELNITVPQQAPVTQ